jgi:hypothetical protein
VERDGGKREREIFLKRKMDGKNVVSQDKVQVLRSCLTTKVPLE